MLSFLLASPFTWANSFPLGEAAGEVWEGAETDRLGDVRDRHFRMIPQELSGHFQTEFVEISDKGFAFLLLIEGAEGRSVHPYIGCDFLDGDGPGVVATDIDADLLQTLFGTAQLGDGTDQDGISQIGHFGHQ